MDRTDTKINTPVAQASSLFDPAIKRDLLAMRNRYGAHSPEGRICSNIIEQLKALRAYVRPAWASHEMQTLPYLIKQQINALARLTGAAR